jgi:hypothetical protein
MAWNDGREHLLKKGSNFNCVFELIVMSQSKRLSGQFDNVVGLDAFPLKRVAIPTLESHDCNSRDGSVADFDSGWAQHLRGHPCLCDG